MKTFFRLFAFFLFINIAAPQKVTAQVSVDFQIFYDDLSPYGTWVNTADYGYAWIPDVPNDFIPYNTNGYWIFTDAGWTWVSDYPWGWAPFHYGRWYTDPEYGPMWIPGNEWGPGWVTWRQSEGYYGWAPIGPGISIDIAYSNSYNVPYNQWTFVHNRNFGRRDINRYYVNRSRNTTIINNTTVINNIREDRKNNARYNGGPDRGDVQKRTGAPIAPVVVRETNKPGQHLGKSELQVYRPQVQQNNNGGQRPAPSKVKDLKDLTPVRNRNNGNDKTQQHPDINNRIPQQNNQPGKQQPQRQEQPQRQQPLPNKQPQEPQPNRQPERQRPQQPERHQPMPPQRQQRQPQPNKQPERHQPMPPQRPQPQPQPNRQQPERHQPMPPQRQQPPQQPPRQQPQPPTKEHGNDPKKEHGGDGKK